MPTAKKLKSKAADIELPQFDTEPACDAEAGGSQSSKEAIEPTTEAMTEPPRPAKLVGDALVAYAAGHRGMNITAEALALGAGYVRKNKGHQGFHGAPQAYSAGLAIASGLAPEATGLGRPKATGERKKRSLAYVVSTNPRTGGTAVTGAYFRELGVEPGTKFRVIVDKDAQELVLQVLETVETGRGVTPEAACPATSVEATPEALPEALVGDKELVG